MLPVSEYVTLQSAAAANGNGTSIPVADYATIVIQVTGTFSAVIWPEVSVDGSNWVSTYARYYANNVLNTYLSSTGMYLFHVTGARYFRTRIASYSSGSVTIVGLLTTAIRNENLFNAGSLSDTTSNPTCTYLGSLGSLFNGTTWDRQRGNVEATALASAARTATVNSSDQTNYNARGVIVTLDVTAVTDTPSLTLSIEAKMGSSYEALLTASAAVTATGIHSYIVYPGVGSASGDVVQVAGFPLPRTWRVTVTHGDTDSATYSVSVCTIL